MADARSNLSAADPHVSADGHRPSRAEIVRLGIGFTVNVLVCAVAWVAVSSLVLPATLADIDPSGKETLLGIINAVGSILSLVSNLVFGALSDTTRSKFGRRTPWIVAGGLVCGASMGLIALFRTSTVMIALLWWCNEVGYTMMLAPLSACMSDRVPDAARGTISGFYGAGNAVGQTLGNYLGAALVSRGTPGLTTGWLIAMGAFGLVGIVTVSIWPREKSSLPMKKTNDGQTNGRQTDHGQDPHQQPSAHQTLRQFGRRLIPPHGRGASDFYRALIGRTLMMAGYSMVGSYLFYICTDYLYAGQAGAQKKAATLIASMSVVQLVITLVATLVGGPLADRLHVRKAPMVLAACLMAVGLLMPLVLRRPAGMYLFVLIASLGSGIYNALDQAFCVDVLPDPDQAGKDLGILSLANTLSTVLGTLLTSAIVGGFKAAEATGNTTPAAAYPVVFVVAIVLVAASAVVIARIRRVR